MIFQSFSQINAIKEKHIAPRPLNFHENKFQRNSPSSHYSHESRLYKKSLPFFEFEHDILLPSLLHGTEQGAAAAGNGGGVPGGGTHPRVASARPKADRGYPAMCASDDRGDLAAAATKGRLQRPSGSGVDSLGPHTAKADSIERVGHVEEL